jgi:thymidine kinase
VGCSWCAIIVPVNIMCPNFGRIEAICGPMFSGKTEELIRRLKRSRIAGKQVQVFHPSIDNRYSVFEIVTHANVRMQSEPVDCVQDLLNRVGWRTQVIGIDEANFFGGALVQAVRQLVDAGKQVIIAGLDLDYLGRPFPPMPDLLALADSISKMAAICVRCGAPAQHTQRLVESEELIFVGAVDSYEARCRRCFKPVIPQREIFDFVGGPE